MIDGGLRRIHCKGGKMEGTFKLFSSWNSCFFLDEHLWGNSTVNKNLLDFCPFQRKLAYLADNEKKQHLFLENGYWKNLRKWCAENKDNIEFFRKLLRSYVDKSDLVKRRVDKITRVKPAKLSNEELGEAFFKARRCINNITPFDQFGMMTSAVFLPELANIMDEKKIGQATMPPWLSTTLREELAVVKTTLDIMEKQGKPLKAEEIADKYRDDLAALSNEFGHVPVFLFNAPWGEKHYALEISEKMKTTLEKLRKRKTELDKFSQTTGEKIEKATRGLNSHLPEIIRILSFTRNEAELVLGYCQLRLAPFYKEICKRLGVSLFQLRHFSEDELRSAINTQKADVAMLNQRIANGVGLYSDADTQRLLTNEEFQELYLLAGKGQSEASGQMLCACPGKAKGRIRIVKDSEDVKSFQQGEVLVALWTCIDYFPAMKKASAFITEGGGITSHASVIARELNVPCIIGYRNATKIFKNGDEVEVNAEKLAVRKIAS